MHNMIDGLTGLTAGTVVTALAAVSLDGASLSIEVVGGLILTVGGTVWWLSSKFTKLDDRLAAIEKVLSNCPAARNNKFDCES